MPRPSQMEITFLGSSNAFASEGRYWSSFIVDGRYVFDAPPTLLPHLKQLNIPLEEIEVLFLTHHHGDHFMGVPFLFLEYVYMTKREKDLCIVGPPGVQEWIDDFANRCYPDITRDAGYRRIYVDAHPGKELRASDISFMSMPMCHVTDQMEALGYRAEIDGKVIAYTGDTTHCEEIYRLAQGADVLVVDCTYVAGSGPEHMGLDDVRKIRDELPHETTIILTHLNGQPDTSGMKNVLTAADLKTFRFD